MSRARRDFTPGRLRSTIRGSPIMPAPKKTSAPKPDLLETLLGMAAAAAKKAFVRLRNEYRAGRDGSPEPARPLPRQTGPAWWTVLGVRETASREQIVAAYRDALRKTHPDKVAHLSDKLRQVAEQETRRINAAYEAAQQALSKRR